MVKDNSNEHQKQLFAILLKHRDHLKGQIKLLTGQLALTEEFLRKGDFSIINSDMVVPGPELVNTPIPTYHKDPYSWGGKIYALLCEHGDLSNRQVAEKLREKDPTLPPFQKVVERVQNYMAQLKRDGLVEIVDTVGQINTYRAVVPEIDKRIPHRG